MQGDALKSMSTDELWNLYEQVASSSAGRIAAEKAKFEERLRTIETVCNVVRLDQRRPYPKVSPKYQHPQNAAETWSGRGKQPRWLTAQLRSGKQLDSFLIKQTEERRRTA